MSISAEAFRALEDHWAIVALNPAERRRASEIVNERLAVAALGEQIQFNFSLAPSATTQQQDDSLLERILLAYELAAVEGVHQLSHPTIEDDSLRDQAVAAAFKAFDIRRLMAVPTSVNERLHFILQFSALAYCGDRWSDLRRWYHQNDEELVVPPVEDVPWDARILYRLFDCWLRLFRKNSWTDMNAIASIIDALRMEQERFETSRLNNESQTEDRLMALRLIALYHWAKGTEILARYILQGEPTDPLEQIDKHFDAGIDAAKASSDAQHEVILRWLHATARLMITGSLWWSIRASSSRASDFVRAITRREHQPLFELLPPQRTALLEKGLLDQAKTAIVIDLPTSGGKTLLAEFRMLQALNQFDADDGWVAYVVPTRALAAQITRRLRQDFEPIGIGVHQLTSAVEIDTFEDKLLSAEDPSFRILVVTPEKLSLVIRNRRVDRPLALVVMDEAHNLEERGRGLRIELLLATIKQDCPHANFLLLMPYVEGTEAVAHWLAADLDAGQAISLGTTPWKPNERIVGLFRSVADDAKRGDWHLEFETLTTTEKAMALRGIHRVGNIRPINVPRSRVLGRDGQKGVGLQSAGMGVTMSTRGTSVAVVQNTRVVWSMAAAAAASLPVFDRTPEDVRLVQDFLRTEIGSDYELIGLLDHGVGVHHSGLSDETKTLMEWLAETSQLRLLCATSTIAQGLNFPVSSVFLASTSYFDGTQMTQMAPREFWNLAGRAGRIAHDSVGVVGIAEGTDRASRMEFISRATGALVSRLVTLLDELAEQGRLSNLSDLLWQDQWEDFRCYIAHLWAEKKNLDAVLADSERLLRQTYGYVTLRNDPSRKDQAEALLAATRSYARELANMPSGVPELADSTGFSPEGVRRALSGIGNLEQRLVPSDWTPESLFGGANRIADLFGVMLTIPQLQQQLEDIGGTGVDHRRLSDIAKDWVNGRSLSEIANAYFRKDDDPYGTKALTEACRAIYRGIVNGGTWGVSALSRMTGIDFEGLPELERRQIDALPAMLYHGVKTEDAVLMRMNFAPRSAAEALGDLYRELHSASDDRLSVDTARGFLKDLNAADWERVRPRDSAMSGPDYKRVWEVLSGAELN